MLSRVRAYLEQRRALGYKLQTEGAMLLNFARAADAAGHRGPLTRALALRWAAQPLRADRLYHARRLEVLRVFAGHQVALEPATEIPPRHFFGPAHRRQTPHLYSSAQIHLLLRRAAQLQGRLRSLTYQTLIGLLACTGLRISEALALEAGGVDLIQRALLVRDSKYHQARWVPLHPTAVPPLRRYVQARARLYPVARHFFVSDRGERFAYSTVRGVFRELARELIPNSGRRQVRLHDLRHTFACQVLLRWQRSKKGAAGRVLILSRYLGHRQVRHTYWYLSATPELLRETARRFHPPA
jgi:site-specific recombinase XerD